MGELGARSARRAAGVRLLGVGLAFGVRFGTGGGMATLIALAI